MQDLRTVVLLRRQLRGEHARATPWVRFGGSAGSPTRATIRRGCRGLLRYPSARLVRMAGLAAIAGAAAVAVADGTTPLVLGVGLALHLLGLDAVEPLSQEIDHPDLTDGVPLDRGWLHVRHLAAPAVGLIPFALIAAAVVAVIDPDRAAAAFALAVPVTWAGVSGAVVSVVRDAPDPLAAPTASNIMPPEVAGFTSTLRLLWPLAISVVGVVPVALAVEFPTIGSVVRGAVASVLLVLAVAGLGAPAGRLATPVAGLHRSGSGRDQGGQEHRHEHARPHRRRTDQDVRRPARLRPARPDRRPRRAGRHARPQRQRQDDVPAHGGRAARADGGHGERARSRRRLDRGPGGDVVPRRHARLLRRPVVLGAPRVHRPAPRHRRLGAARRRPPRLARTVGADATTSRRRSAAVCARRRPSPSRSSVRSS